MIIQLCNSITFNNQDIDYSDYFKPRGNYRIKFYEYETIEVERITTSTGSGYGGLRNFKGDAKAHNLLEGEQITTITNIEGLVPYEISYVHVIDDYTIELYKEPLPKIYTTIFMKDEDYDFKWVDINCQYVENQNNENQNKFKTFNLPHDFKNYGYLFNNKNKIDNKIKIINHGLDNNTIVKYFKYTGTTHINLEKNVDYNVIKIDNDHIKLKNGEIEKQINKSDNDEIHQIYKTNGISVNYVIKSENVLNV